MTDSNSTENQYDYPAGVSSYDHMYQGYQAKVLEAKRVADVGVAKEQAVAGLDMHYESSLYLNDV